MPYLKKYADCKFAKIPVTLLKTGSTTDVYSLHFHQKKNSTMGILQGFFQAVLQKW